LRHTPQACASMRDMARIITLILLMQSLISCAQDEGDRIKIERINSFVKDNIVLSSQEYAIYFLTDKYMVIEQANDSLIVSYLSEKSGFEGSSNYDGEILQTLFSRELFASPFHVYMGNDFNSSCVGSLLYLSLYDANQIVSEFLLPSILHFA
jgi:hypothetical protein